MSESAVNSTSTAAGIATFSAALFLLYVVSWLKKGSRRSGMSNMLGPPCKSWLWGSSPDTAEFDVPKLQQQWIRSYGRTFSYRGIFTERKLFTADPKAMAHVMSRSKYIKPPPIRTSLSWIVGDGLLCVEGAQHKQQKRVLNPAFGIIELRKHAETFSMKANELCAVWKTMCSDSESSSGDVMLDVFSWLNKATLDIITLAGFGYDTDSLHATDDRPNELTEAVRGMFSFGPKDVLFLLQAFVPIFRLIPTQRLRQLRESQSVIRRIGSRLIAEGKAALLRGNEGRVLKKDVEGSDLLSLLIKANAADDLPESLRLNDEDILAQIPTFIIAGHETISTAATMALFALAGSQATQETLRRELREVSTSTPSVDELNSLPYLDKVIREAIRLYSPTANIERVASEDDIVPLSEPYTDLDGKVHHEIIISKGEGIFMPIHALQSLEEIWGPDANEFRPERWDSIPDAAKQFPNVWGNLVSFAAGPHACIGYRFAIMEMKALLFAIIRTFEFELAVPASDVTFRVSIVARPGLASDPSGGWQLPLMMRPAKIQSDSPPV